MSANYQILAEHYESCLVAHGDSHRGVDWPDAADAETRYRVMLDIARNHPGPRILDLGCGAAHLLDFAMKEGRSVEYIGVDISPAFIDICRDKHPKHAFICADVLQDELPIGPVDFVVMNGLFTEKLSLSDEEMFQFTTEMLKRAFCMARVGIAFNVMSKLVDWEREDLFHVSFDRVACFLRRHLTRHFVMRHDYDLYDYTTYAYRESPP